MPNPEVMAEFMLEVMPEVMQEVMQVFTVHAVGHCYLSVQLGGVVATFRFALKSSHVHC